MVGAIFISGPCGAGKSSVADNLSQLLNCRIVEVDDVKRERYGTTERSTDDDFTQAGRRAKEVLREDDEVIVVEAFATEFYVELVRRELPDHTPVQHFYLWSDEAEAVRRKDRKLSLSVVHHQFRRFPGRTYRGRTSIDTTARTASDIAAEIALTVRGTASR